MNTTTSGFTVTNVALHLINKKEDELRFADHEIDRTAFRPVDNQAIDEFFDGHLKAIWDAPGSNTIRAANFLKTSKIKAQYTAIKTESSPFLKESVNMAQALYDIAPKSSSAGLLMALWFTARGKRRPFLALLKMDPGKSDKIIVRSKGDQLLLDLAVQHIEQALPDPEANNRVLKWAVTPHPTLGYDVKIKDSQSTPDPAAYFMTFLGCEARKSERQQLAAVLGGLSTAAVNRLIPQIGAASVDGRLSLGSIGKSNILTKSEIDVLERKVKAAGAEDLNVSSQAIENAKLIYRLSNDIVIRGPLLEMKRIQINPDGNNAVEFRIRANSYEEVYE
jgi:hypothetical protein